MVRSRWFDRMIFAPIIFHRSFRSHCPTKSHIGNRKLPPIVRPKSDMADYCRLPPISIFPRRKFSHCPIFHPIFHPTLRSVGQWDAVREADTLPTEPTRHGPDSRDVETKWHIHVVYNDIKTNKHCMWTTAGQIMPMSITKCLLGRAKNHTPLSRKIMQITLRAGRLPWLHM